MVPHQRICAGRMGALHFTFSFCRPARLRAMNKDLSASMTHTFSSTTSTGLHKLNTGNYVLTESAVVEASEETVVPLATHDEDEMADWLKRRRKSSRTRAKEKQVRKRCKHSHSDREWERAVRPSHNTTMQSTVKV